MSLHPWGSAHVACVVQSGGGGGGGGDKFIRNVALNLILLGAYFVFESFGDGGGFFGGGGDGGGDSGQPHSPRHACMLHHIPENGEGDPRTGQLGGLPWNVSCNAPDLRTKRRMINE